MLLELTKSRRLRSVGLRNTCVNPIKEDSQELDLELGPQPGERDTTFVTVRVTSHLWCHNSKSIPRLVGQLRS